MIPFNGLMNHISEMSYAETFITKHISTRFSVVVGAFPLEFCASIENIIRFPFQTGRVLIKLACKAVNICLDLQAIKNFTDKQPTITDLFKTALKVVGYALSAFVTLTFGFLRPHDNFRLHVAFRLINDEKALAEKLVADLKAATEKQEQEKAMQTHIENLVLIMRQKAKEREEQLKIELEKHTEQNPPPISKVAENEVHTPAEVLESTNTLNDEINVKLVQEHQRIVTN